MHLRDGAKDVAADEDVTGQVRPAGDRDARGADRRPEAEQGERVRAGRVATDRVADQPADDVGRRLGHRLRAGEVEGVAGAADVDVVQPQQRPDRLPVPPRTAGDNAEVGAVGRNRHLDGHRHAGQDGGPRSAGERQCEQVGVGREPATAQVGEHADADRQAVAVDGKRHVEARVDVVVELDDRGPQRPAGLAGTGDVRHRLLERRSAEQAGAVGEPGEALLRVAEDAGQPGAQRRRLGDGAGERQLGQRGIADAEHREQVRDEAQQQLLADVGRLGAGVIGVEDGADEQLHRGQGLAVEARRVELGDPPRVAGAVLEPHADPDAALDIHRHADADDVGSVAGAEGRDDGDVERVLRRCGDGGHVTASGVD